MRWYLPISIFHDGSNAPKARRAWSSLKRAVASIPDSGATWIECAGAYAVFDGVDSPVTQSFGLGLFEPLTPAALDRIEAFFLDRGAVVVHEVSPLAGIATLDLLCARGYRPIELSSVLHRPVENPRPKSTARLRCGGCGEGRGRYGLTLARAGGRRENPEMRGLSRAIRCTLHLHANIA